MNSLSDAAQNAANTYNDFNNTQMPMILVVAAAIIAVLISLWTQNRHRH